MRPPPQVIVDKICPSWHCGRPRAGKKRHAISSTCDGCRLQVPDGRHLGIQPCGRFHDHPDACCTFDSFDPAKPAKPENNTLETWKALSPLASHSSSRTKVALKCCPNFYKYFTDIDVSGHPPRHQFLVRRLPPTLTVFLSSLVMGGAPPIQQTHDQRALK